MPNVKISLHGNLTQIRQESRHLPLTGVENIFTPFSLFSLILKCLKKIVDDQASGILVFPYWSSQPWFPLLQSRLSSEITSLSPYKNLLHSHYRDCHPLHKGLTLAVSKLLQQSFSRRESPPEVITLMLASLSDKTIRSYII